MGSVPSTQSPCPNSVVLNDNNAWDMLSDYSSNKTAIKCFDTSQVTNMDGFFENTDFNADISSWDVSSVEYMKGMFGEASEFNSDVFDWDVSSVTNMNYMFGWATKFNGDVSDWDVSSVENMKGMFGEASEFNSDVFDWDVS